VNELSEFNEVKLREFLVAVMASGNRPSASLIKALAKLSGIEYETVETLAFEVFPTLKADFAAEAADARQSA